MSILLDALRKSEKDQQKAESPNIHSIEQRDPVSGSFNRKILLLFLFVVLIALGWFVWNQYFKSDGGYQPPVTLTVEEKTEHSVPAAKTQTADGEGTRAVTPIQSLSDAVPSQRTPVESYQKPAVEASKSSAANSGEVIPKTPPENKRKVKKVDGQGTKAGNNANAKKKAPAKATPTAKVDEKIVASGKQAAGKPVAAGQKEFQPEKPAPIGYWELPDSIRAVVPEIRFSVLVWARKKTDRFVLIDGVRYGHWDKLPSGVIVKEIQREGVVFKYRLYEFLVER